MKNSGNDKSQETECRHALPTHLTIIAVAFLHQLSDMVKYETQLPANIFRCKNMAHVKSTYGGQEFRSAYMLFQNSVHQYTKLSAFLS